MNKRNELIESVKESLRKLEPIDRGWDLLTVVALTATIAVLKYESEIFSSTGDSHDAAYAIELYDVIKEYQTKLEELWHD